MIKLIVLALIEYSCYRFPTSFICFRKISINNLK